MMLTDTHPTFTSEQLYTYLATLFYARRSKMNPVWNACLVGGWDQVKKERYELITLLAIGH